MDLGVLLSDVTAAATTTFGGFGDIIALSVGAVLAIGIIKKVMRLK
jgi:hypothetical protein